MADRDSQSGELELITDLQERARVEAHNAFRQTRVAMELLPSLIREGQPKLRPSLFLNLHRVLMEKVSPYPGVFRPGPMSISKSDHKPPPAAEVPTLIEGLCEYVNDHWSSKSALHLAAYILWRTNWIHPFADGNGRTARIVSYLILCAHTKTELPGDVTIPKQISAGKAPYYTALEDADRHCRTGAVDVTALEDLLGSCLARQLVDFFEKAGGRSSNLDDDIRLEIDEAISAARAIGIEVREAQPILPSLRKKRRILDGLEARPVLYGGLLAISIAVVGWLFFR